MAIRKCKICGKYYYGEENIFNATPYDDNMCHNCAYDITPKTGDNTNQVYPSPETKYGDKLNNVK